MRVMALLIIILISVKTYSQNVQFSVDTIQIKSELLKENRSIVVYKPNSISVSEKVRFIYLIDGESSGYRYQNMYTQFGDTISDLIAVGIINTDRRRDLLYALGAGLFIDFITAELIPRVEKDYRVKSRILFGHSFGGSFALCTLIQRPGAFEGYIVSSPTPIMDLVNQESYRCADGSGQITLCLSMGSEDIKQVKKWTLILKDNLSGMEFGNLSWSFQIFDGKSHNNSDIPALISGLKRFN